MAVVVKVRYTRHVPPAPQRGSGSVVNASVVVHVPHPCLTGVGPEQEIIWMVVVVKVRYTRHVPPAPQRGSGSVVNASVIVHVPHRCLTGARVLKHKIRAAVAVKVSYASASHQRVRINVRRVSRHRSAIEIVSALCNGSTARSLVEVNLVIVGVHVVPRVTRLGCLLHPPRLIPLHRAYLRAEARLVEDLDHLANLVCITSGKPLRTPLGNRERVVRI